MKRSAMHRVVAVRDGGAGSTKHRPIRQFTGSLILLALTMVAFAGPELRWQELR
jgi:hypothetical protein